MFNGKLVLKNKFLQLQEGTCLGIFYNKVAGLAGFKGGFKAGQGHWGF